jgi:hypothetical protein
MVKSAHIIQEVVDTDSRIPFKKRLGRCYELAGRFASNNEGAILVHGSIEGFGKPRIGHAWVEVDGQVWEPASGKMWDPKVFDMFFSPEEEFRYDHEGVLVMSLRSSHWGPWDEPFVSRRKRSEF